MRRNILILLLCASTLYVGCAGREAMPIRVHQPGDEGLSCAALSRQVGTTQEAIVAKKKKIKSKQTWNVIWIIGGCIIIVPFFFMNLKGAEEAELEALKMRHDRLMGLAIDRGCTWATEK